ncbi:hypothetical protein ES703_96673 [subsurface metagenome]
MLISRGNLKIGSLPSFSLPVVTTCPGKTPFCERYCFGLKGNFRLLNVLEANDRRLDATLRSDFVDIMVNEIRQTRAPAFRLHVVGDFYSVEYIHKWVDIAGALPDVIFFGSTRSWRCEFLSEAIKLLRDLDNFYMKASVDATDTLSPQGCGWSTWAVEGRGMTCPHDEGKVANCLECKRCWTRKDLDVTFKLRWGRPAEYLTPRLFN